MKNVTYKGIPSVQGRPADQAVQILYDHCHQMAQIMMKMNGEIEDLKYEVEQLKFK